MSRNCGHTSEEIDMMIAASEAWVLAKVAEALRAGSTVPIGQSYYDGLGFKAAADYLTAKPEPLKACPVCGKQPKWDELHELSYYVCRHNEDVKGWSALYGPDASSEPEARRLWNTLPSRKP